jgi:hypothetical protein
MSAGNHSIQEPTWAWTIGGYLSVECIVSKGLPRVGCLFLAPELNGDFSVPRDQWEDHTIVE